MRTVAALPFTIFLVALPGCHGHSNPNPASPTGPPVLMAVTPSQASVGDAITLSGSAFAPSGNAIRFGAGYLHGVASEGGTSLSFPLPSALTPCPPGTDVCITLALVVTPGTYQVSVINAKGTSNALPLQVVAR